MDYCFSDKIRSLKPSAIREIFKSLTDPSVISFAAGNPSAESFPVEDIKRISAEIFQSDAVAALQYNITEGYTPLRGLCRERQQKKFGIGRDFDDTIIVSGGQQGIELACKIFCNEGDAVVCENPSFIGALNAFRSLGAVPVGVQADFDGINIEMLEKTLQSTKNVKLIYLIPTFQNPTGITMSLSKRVAVLEVAKKYNVPVFEDNPYGELRFDGEDIPTLKSMDRDGIVVYCSSFSKILAPGIRVGFVIANSEITAKMVVAKQSEDVHTNIFAQLLCYRILTETDIDAHIESVKNLYRHKYRLMRSALAENIPGEIISFTNPQGGLFIYGTLSGESDSSGFVREALNRKVAVVPGATFNCDAALPSPSFRLNYSMPSDAEIAEGVKRLGDCARAVYRKGV